MVYLCVQFPPSPVSQEQILPHITLDDSNSNSTKNKLSYIYSHSLFSFSFLFFFFGGGGGVGGWGVLASKQLHVTLFYIRFQ